MKTLFASCSTHHVYFCVEIALWPNSFARSSGKGVDVVKGATRVAFSGGTGKSFSAKRTKKFPSWPVCNE